MKTAFLRSVLELALLLGLALAAACGLSALLGRRGTTFRPTAGRQLRLAFWPLLALGTGLSAVPAVALGRGASVFEWTLAAGLGAVTLALGGPALLLHARYYARNAGTALVFEPAQNRLEVYENGIRQPFERRDLVGLDYVTCRHRHSFRAPYAYLRLHRQGGAPAVVLTSLLCDLPPLVAFLRAVPGPRRAVAWPWV